MKLYWIFKITSRKRPNECVVYFSGTERKHPETQMKSFMKGRLRHWRENPSACSWRPYFPFAEDIQVEAEVIGRTALYNQEELIKYCETLTIILNSEKIDLEIKDINLSHYTNIEQEDVATNAHSAELH